MTTTIWLNSHFSCIQSIRNADQANEFFIIASDHNLENPEVLTADIFNVEPLMTEARHYVDYALDMVQKFQVNIFFPGRYIKEIAQRVEEFQALGVKVILAADCEVLAVLGDQAAMYEILVTDLQNAIPAPAHYAPQLVSEYLAGDLCSVDSLASNGRLLRYVVSRTRASGTITLERNPDIEHMVAQLVAYFKLNGVFNVQFRIKRGKPILLSISPRMSGGITMSCLCGVDFPFWALKLALNPGCEHEIPKARQHPLRVA